jgi:flagellar protein FliS
MNAVNVYRQMQAHTAPPGELVVMLYRGAARFAATAATALEARDVELAHNSLIRAQAIISELAGALDLEQGYEVTRHLVLLYDYLSRRLIEANVRKDAAIAREVERLLRDLLSAWEVAARQAGNASIPATCAA